ncbi:hypothetical protein DCAR_0101612 [Daucus carota subsp. sativus]|uniref:Uncharacterized protein n=1 Tax=Daucus carota subsp. sativus TaxID=79200 RepID=A0AAF0W6D8_DAUCS|nr:hypothetical protein DCAR_0101612 [Daucus carota subsp. sativus]
MASSLLLAFNAIFVVIFFLMISSVQSSRPIANNYSSSSSSSCFLGLLLERAYSGPSRRGRGH